MSSPSSPSSPLDVLSLLIQHASSLASITYTSSDGEPVSDLLSCSFIKFPGEGTPAIPRTTKTRVVRSRNADALQADSLAVPTSSSDDSPSADDFLPLDALVFLLQTQEEAVGLYAVKATREKVARVDTLDRPNLLDFLLGRKSEAECEVVLSADVVKAREAKRADGGGGQQSKEDQDGATTATADAGLDSIAPSAVPATATTTDAAAAAAAAISQTTAAPSSSSSSSALHPLLANGKRPYVPSKQDASFVKRLRSAEVVLRDRAWAFRCQKSNVGKASANGAADGDDEEDEADDEYHSGVASERANGSKVNGNGIAAPGGAGARDVDFSALRRSVQGRIADLRRGGSGAGGVSGNTAAASSTSRRPGASASASTAPSSAPSSNASTPSSSSTLGRSQRHRRLDPIIILPSSPSSLLTLSNIKAFLEEGRFVAPSSATTLAPTGGSNEVVVINRPNNGGRFLAIDSLDALNRLGASRDGATNDPWRRVACVVTTGQKWQFKGYRWEEGRELFRNGGYSEWQANRAR